MAEEFVGTGVAFPVRTDASGSLALVSGETEIRESIRLILGTAFGERPMRPEFGCGIHDLVFAPSDARTAYEVRQSIERWEPRIALHDVDVTFDDADTGTMLIALTYAVRGTNDPRNLVFPFYTLPAEE
jgi:phage baseplate assembly protein W